jgi:hypothetical protein
MGHKTIWDGRGLPDIGDHVLFISGADKVTVGCVTAFTVDRPTQMDIGWTWRILVHMDCFSDLENLTGHYQNARNLEDLRPLDWRPVFSAVRK